ncbi:MAG TPA: histidine kinase [Trebonia sp.]|nr:histidine kinase [Trebonia sp.]
MADRPGLAEFMTILRRGVHPPVREWRFWAIQAVVLIIAGVHILVDIDSVMETGAFPAGIPVALLILPAGYAALRYGLAGSAATGLWATLLWLPDLLLPHDEGHVGSDVINLALVNLVAFFVGHRIEAERLAHERAQRATAEHLAADARYRQLFQTKRAPILVLDAEGAVLDANPAARVLYGADVIGRRAADVTGETGILAARHRPVVCLPNGRDYRLDIVPLPAGPQRSLTQVIFEDVTEERSEQRRVTRYAAAVVQAEEDQRQRLARELHDEPLQLFLHLARRLGDFGRIPGGPPDVAEGLVEARRQALDAAARLRSLARGLRPPPSTSWDS